MIWRDRLKQVINGVGLTIWFQPIYRLDIDDSNGFTLLGYEALSRFFKEEDVTLEAISLGLIDDQGRGFSPDVWFSHAAVEFMTVDLEMKAAKLSLDQLSDIPEKLYLSINAGPETVTSGRLHEVLKLTDDSHRVIIELTEHEAIVDYKTIRKDLSNLCSPDKIALSIAIDDFGAGSASMQHVLQIWDIVSFCKLDASLTSRINQDPVRQELVKGIINMGKAADFKVIAEAVEEEDQMKCLREIEVYAAQGWYFGKAAPLPNK